MIPADEHFFEVEARLNHCIKQIKHLRMSWWQAVGAYPAGNYKAQLLLSQFFRSVDIKATGLTVVGIPYEREGDLVVQGRAIRNWPGDHLLFVRLLSDVVKPYEGAVFLELLRQDQEEDNAFR